MSPTDPSSILTTTKSSFITSQIRLLSQPLHTPVQNPLPDTATEKVVSAVNKKITSYNRLHFGLESQRHVVEQIDGIYWRDVLAGGLPVRKAETVVKRDVDLSEGGKGLPEIWEDVVLRERPRKKRRLQQGQDRDVGATDCDADMHESEEDTAEAGQQPGGQDDPQARRYSELRGQLHSHAERRNELRRKLRQYKRLQGLLAPFEKPSTNIQPNLITKDNKELEAELAKMRVLLARVGNGIQSQPRRLRAQPDHTTHQNTMTDTKKLETVLELG